MKRIILFLLLVAFGTLTTFAQLHRAHYKIVTEYRKQPDSMQGKQNLPLAILNQIMEREELVPILEITAATNLIKFRYLPPRQENPGLITKMPTELITYNKKKKETVIVDKETQAIKGIWMLSSDEHEILKDKDTLINGDNLRIIELGLKDSPEEGTRLFYIDENLPDKITPVGGNFQKDLNVKGGIRKYHVIHEDKIIKYVLESFYEIPNEIMMIYNMHTLPKPIEKIAFF
ncbi:hypothetical protein [Mesonia maritima]|uniref:Uncharacterized protein n=1 Tax=Mesonia maritima TaxID=1793873 RepID=A0ABU1K4I5_9FLAO|nr:hypothetical protein [Mesonia maritima]MDR6300504.1 hypothetical protein [Mesonia maritima]